MGTQLIRRRIAQCGATVREIAVDPAARFSLLPDHPPSAGEEAENEQ